MGYIRQCPRCKSNKGIRVDYTIISTGHEIRDFRGNVSDADQDTGSTTDDITCLNCGADLRRYNVES